MSDLQIIVASTAVVVGGAYTLREVFRRSVIGDACRTASQKIEQFKKDNFAIAPMTPDRKAVAKVLHETIIHAHEMRRERMTDAKKIKLPNPKIPMDLRELQATMNGNKNIFIGALKETYKYKTKDLFWDAVKKKLQSAQGIHVAQNLTENIGKNFTPHSPRHIDQAIAGILDETGLPDIGADIGHYFINLNESLHGFVHDHIPQIEPLMADLIDAAHDVADIIHAIPGALSAMKSIKREIQLLMDNETTFEDAMVNGILPSAAKVIAIKVGLALDAHTGATGAFTTALSALTRKAINNKLLNNDKELREEFSNIIDEIKRCHDEILKHINKKTREFEESFARLIAECPNINNEEPLKLFINELKEVFALGFSNAQTVLSSSARREIENLPQDTWLEQILFINKRKAVEKLYLQAQRELYESHESLVHNFTLAAEQSPDEALDYMLKNAVFDRSEMMTVLRKIEGVIEATTQAYMDSLLNWEDLLKKLRNSGEKNMADIIKEQSDIYQEFVDDREPRMAQIKHAIKLNNLRLGMKKPKTQEPREEYGEASYG